MRRDFVRSSWPHLAGIAVAAVIFTAMAARFIEDDFGRGLVVAFVPTAVFAGLLALTIVASGSGSVSMGAWAEGWTADELKGLEAHGYRVIHHAGLRRGDIDHFVVGPGGVFVLETKWSARDWRPDGKDAYALRAIQQVERERDTLSRWLPTGYPPAVSVLVLWGAAAAALDGREADAARTAGGTVVLRGSALERWMLGRGRAALDVQQVQTAFDLMAVQVGKRDLIEPPAPRSISATLESAYLAAVAFSLTITGSALVSVHVNPPVSAVLGVTLAVAGHAALHRTQRWRWPVAATALGAGLWAAFVGTVYAVALISSR